MSTDATTTRQSLVSASGWAFFAVGYLFTYFVSTAVPMPLVWYYPLEHRFAFEVRSTGLAADFYGRLMLCLLVGGIALVLGRVIVARTSEERLHRALRLGLAWTAGLLLFTAGLYIYLLIGRMPFPAPLPPDYVPR